MGNHLPLHRFVLRNEEKRRQLKNNITPAADELTEADVQVKRRLSRPARTPRHHPFQSAMLC
jgi:hypothetical protein